MLANTSSLFCFHVNEKLNHSQFHFFFHIFQATVFRHSEQNPSRPETT